MFQIKSRASIVASMINRITAMSDDLTDFNNGSKIRTTLEAVASEMEEYYQALLKGLYEAIPVAIYKTFSFDREDATASSGYVTFTRKTGTEGDIIISHGKTVGITDTDFQFTVVGDFVLANGVNTIDVLVTCTKAGKDTNCLANTITEMVDFISKDIESITNKSAFTDGSDEETDAERKARFQKWLSTLARSIREAIAYGAKTVQLKNEAGLVTEEVKKVIVREPAIDDDNAALVGYTDVYIWNGVDGASPALLQAVKQSLYGYTDANGRKIPGWKAAGIILTVYTVSTNARPVTATVTLEKDINQANIDKKIKNVIDDYFNNLEIGETLIWGKLYDAIISLDGIKDLSMTAPATNMATTDWKHINVKGTVTLTYA